MTHPTQSVCLPCQLGLPPFFCECDLYSADEVDICADCGQPLNSCPHGDQHLWDLETYPPAADPTDKR